MSEDKLKNLICRADRDAGQQLSVEVDISAIRRRAKSRKIYTTYYPVAAAAVVILAVFFLNIFEKKPEKQIGYAANDIVAQIKQLHESTDNTINLIREIFENEEKQKRISDLESELASIPDPIKQINEELDRTAFILVYSADKMYKELNLTSSAVETYKRVIKLFPDNQWAQVARERLEEIKNQRNNNDSSKGESKWKQQNTLS